MFSVKQFAFSSLVKITVLTPGLHKSIQIRFKVITIFSEYLFAYNKAWFVACYELGMDLN